ncbi:MAG: glycoside hydrolase family 1 protein [Blastocatellia bacterium]|nr:glycoside hydrolase family 1 protein [Blastocatellia bacterium]
MTELLSEALVFPKDFMWGTATSSHQVEGENRLNDWWAFEQRPGNIYDGSISGQACDHYKLYKSDIDLLKSLHQNAHRISLEWSRIEPEEGKFDSSAIAHYRDVLETLKANGIEPLLTIHHFTNPLWLAAKGAWENREVISYFKRFTELVAREYGDIVRYWVTINEPMVYAFMGYMLLHWPPSRSRPDLGFASAANMMRAHAVAYEVLHTRTRIKPEVGIAHNMRIFDPANEHSFLDRKVAAWQDYLFNELIISALAESRLRLPLGYEILAGGAKLADFIGLNYYSRDLVAFDLRSVATFFGRNFPSPDAELSLFGWEIYPKGLYRMVKRLSKYNLPILITENGFPDETDEQRPRALLDHLIELQRAIKEGIDIRGYFHWSFIDNFEWAEGYRTPFGLVAVDFSTQKRTVKNSGQLYKEICRTGTITPEMQVSVKGRSDKPRQHLNLYGKRIDYVNNYAPTGDSGRDKRGS